MRQRKLENLFIASESFSSLFFFNHIPFRFLPFDVEVETYLLLANLPFGRRFFCYLWNGVVRLHVAKLGVIPLVDLDLHLFWAGFAAVLVDDNSEGHHDDDHHDYNHNPDLRAPFYPPILPIIRRLIERIVTLFINHTLPVSCNETQSADALTVLEAIEAY